MTTNPVITDYMMPGGRVHLIGIGGVSMAPLAEALLGAGLVVTGSDMAESTVTERLRGMGIAISIGHRAENVGAAQCIIRTAAAREDNPEVMAARATGIPIFERAQGWGHIMRQYKNAICIAGTHGKTSTTSMTTHILMAAGVDPTVMIGGTLPKLQAGHRVGDGDTIVLESCEYYDSFHNFFPTVAVVLNVEEDHLDYFKNLAGIQASFRKFAALVPDNGCIVANGDDPNTIDALTPLGRPLMTFGLQAGNRVRGENVVYTESNTSFDVTLDGAFYAHVTLQLPGAHNVSNALAAIAAAIFLHLPATAVVEGLADFTGAGRRFEYKGEVQGATIYDDYAHHPSELKALLDAVEPLGYDRVIVAFQPHTYTRTKAFFDEFVQELKRPDMVLMGEIFAAREQNTVGITAADLAAEIPGAVHYGTLAEMTEALRGLASPGDLILTVGAGDIYKVGEGLL
ncbi:MAG: UDP-N-acetylmuramate--L-alanine ligase [Oscillospiraceae bacterium]|nr:UDP-N-acetylmuramate--L-alanine ligase [Oscillospiraceae bacterium]